MNPQGNTMQPPAPLARKAERVLMTIAAAYNVIMASITLFMFTSWFKGQAYDLLEHNGLLKTDYSAVDNEMCIRDSREAPRRCHVPCDAPAHKYDERVP